MLGFGKKPQPEVPQPSIPVVTIPTEFYAGSNPTITFRKVEKVIIQGAPKPMPVADKKAFDKATATGMGKPMHPANIFSNHKKLLLIGGVLFVLFIVGGSIYFYSTQQPAEKKAPTAPKTEIPKVVAAIPTTTPQVLPPPPEEVIPKLTDGKIEYPSMLLSKAADLDVDGLTDAEEGIFKSDAGIPDSDFDNYLDGSEIFHLYNPVGKEPIKLIDSGSVIDYINPGFNYAIYYPMDWQVGNVSGDYRDMLFSTISGDYVEVRLFDKSEQQTFPEWLAETAPGEKFSDLVEFVNRFGDVGYKRSDEMVYYFMSASRIYAIVYHTTDSVVANYPGVIEMMARSFRRDASKEAIILPPPTQPDEVDGLPDNSETPADVSIL